MLIEANFPRITIKSVCNLHIASYTASLVMPIGDSPGRSFLSHPSIIISMSPSVSLSYSVDSQVKNNCVLFVEVVKCVAYMLPRATVFSSMESL